MIPLSIESRHLMFGAAGKRVSTAAKTTTTKTRASTKTKSTGGSASGMLMAVGLDSTTPRPAAKTKTTTLKKAPASKRDVVFREINKYGMIALSGTTLINHANNTIHKLVAAANGDEAAFRFYEDKSKSYLKPHFSLPSQWHQMRTTFGTPWYY